MNNPVNYASKKCAKIKLKETINVSSTLLLKFKFTPLIYII